MNLQTRRGKSIKAKKKTVKKRAYIMYPCFLLFFFFFGLIDLPPLDPRKSKKYKKETEKRSGISRDV